MNILIVTGNPKQNNHTQILCDTYAKEAKENDHEIKTINVYDNEWKTSYATGGRLPERDPDISIIKASQDAIVWADEVVFIHPVWWAYMPAGLKNWIDNVFTPGFSYKYTDGKPIALLSKKAKVFCTTGSYAPYYLFPLVRLLTPLHLLWKYAILGFNGFDLIDFKVCDQMNINNSHPPVGRFEKFLRRISFSAKFVH